MVQLLLQILGNSDVVVDSQSGTERLRGYSLEEVQELSEINEEELIAEIERVDFPLIREIQNKQTANTTTYFGIILTDQANWLETQEMSLDAWNDIIASDGIWWKNILKTWCQHQGIELFPVHLMIPCDSKRGVADWEGMATLLKEELAQLVTFEGEKMQFHPRNAPPKPIDKILIQHSSGTPATSSGLYLWGIEQKLARKPIEFAYLSRQDSSYVPHDGEQWQWRFKIPQIRQLCEIKDFSGALQLLENYPNNDFKKKIRYLDRATSFNLTDLSDIDRSPKGKVLERIAIALWSEQAFRQEGQWMHWYLRVAGAFELAIFCLLEQQGHPSFSWENNPNNLKKSELIYQQQPFRLSIKKTVTELLGTGQSKDSFYSQTFTYQATPVQDQKWNNFQTFYTNPQGWVLSQNFKTAFLEARNQLYHALQGDQIDETLDKKTQELKSINHPDHPSEIAIQYLWYIVTLAGQKTVVENRIQNYQNRLQTVNKNLEWIYKLY